MQDGAGKRALDNREELLYWFLISDTKFETVLKR